MIAALNLNHLIRMSAEGMLNCILQGVVIGLFAWVVLRLIGRRNSGTRFAVWFSALLAIAALPVLGIASSSSVTGRVASAITVPSSWAFDIFILWATIAGVSLLRVGIGLRKLRTLRASCRPIDTASLDPLLSSTLQECRNVRSVTLCHSDRLHVPTAIGFLKPVVVIPSWALQELSTAELHSILIHELAHLRRWDDWTNLAQQVLKALLFFHPAVWWIENQLALEREMACDDAVLAETGNPRGYAQCLVSMAEKTFLRRGLALAQAVVNRTRQTSLRVSQILDADRPTATHIWKPAVYSVAAFFVVCLVSISHAPELVAFQDRAPDATVAAAHETLNSPADQHLMETRAFARPASFHTNAAVAAAQRPSRSLGSQNIADRIRSGMSSPVPLNAEYRILEREKSTAPQVAQYRHDSSVLQVAEFRVWQGTGSVVPRSATIAQPIFTQTIFVVTETQYDESRPSVTVTVWHVTVLDSTGNPSQARMLAKQI